MNLQQMGEFLGIAGAKKHAEEWMGVAPGTGERRRRIVWLHTQPEAYFNCFMDDLARGTGYRVYGQEKGPQTNSHEYIAAFAYRGTGVMPRVAKSVLLRPRRGKESHRPGFVERYHENWRQDLQIREGDLVIVSGYGSVTARELLADCRSRGVPVALFSDSNIRTRHGRGGAGGAGRIRRRVKKAFLAPIIEAASALLTANSRGDAYWRYFGAPREKIVRCPYYADYAAIDRARNSDREAVLRQLGLQREERVLLSVARLAPEKGLELGLRAFRELGLGTRGFRYVLVGAGAMETRLKAEAGVELGKSVFFAGQQPPDRVAEWMAHAELLLVPSRAEPHGIVVQEAMAAGTPVVASSAVGSAADLVTHGESGMIFRNDDTSDLGRKLAAALEPEKLSALRRAARPAFESWYARASPIDIIAAIAKRLPGGSKTEDS